MTVFLEVDPADEPPRLPLIAGPKDKQHEFLDDRMRQALAAQPKLAQLEERVLTVGGVGMVPPDGIEEDLERILARGEVFDSRDALQRPSRPRDCHANSAALWEAHPERYTICTGYALSTDGFWRQHSWAIERRTKRLVETTRVRLAYFGYRLDGLEAEKFASANG